MNPLYDNVFLVNIEVFWQVLFKIYFYFVDFDVTLTKQMEFTTFTCSGYLVKLGGIFGVTTCCKMCVAIYS